MNGRSKNIDDDEDDDDDEEDDDDDDEENNDDDDADDLICGQPPPPQNCRLDSSWPRGWPHPYRGLAEEKIRFCLKIWLYQTLVKTFEKRSRTVVWLRNLFLILLKDMVVLDSCKNF